MAKSNSKVEYTEIARAKVTKSRNIVISNCSEGGFTIAQQFEAVENGKIIPVFLKGAFHVDDLTGLYELRDAINLAISKTEADQENDWDPTEETDQ